MERYEKICPTLKTGRVLKTSAFLTAGLICFGAAAHAETETVRRLAARMDSDQTFEIDQMTEMLERRTDGPLAVAGST